MNLFGCLLDKGLKGLVRGMTRYKLRHGGSDHLHPEPPFCCEEYTGHKSPPLVDLSNHIFITMLTDLAITFNNKIVLHHAFALGTYGIIYAIAINRCLVAPLKDPCCKINNICHINHNPGAASRGYGHRSLTGWPGCPVQERPQPSQVHSCPGLSQPWKGFDPYR